jgi:hypothetical protein
MRERARGARCGRFGREDSVVEDEQGRRDALDGENIVSTAPGGLREGVQCGPGEARAAAGPGRLTRRGEGGEWLGRGKHGSARAGRSGGRSWARERGERGAARPRARAAAQERG